HEGKAAPVWRMSLEPDEPQSGEAPVTGMNLTLERPTGYPCGVVLMWQPQPVAAPREFELLAWVRAAYRMQWIGRRRIPPPLHAPWQELRERHAAGESFSRLPRLPATRSSGRGDSLQRAMWFNFFRAYGFLARTVVEPAPDKDLVLERAFVALSVAVLFQRRDGQPLAVAH